MRFNLLSTLIYALVLCWIYSVEFLKFWGYMGFRGEFTPSVLASILLFSLLLALFLPKESRTTRAYIVTMLHYLFFVPSVVYASFNEIKPDYAISLLIVAFATYIMSAMPVRRIAGRGLSSTQAQGVITGSIFFALFLQASFGGLNNFNLNLEDVYLYRTAATHALPGIFGYIFSNVANVLIPASIVLAIRLRSKGLALLGIFSAVVLFGMSQQKSVLFTSVYVLIIYYLFRRSGKSQFAALFPLAVVAISGIEIFYTSVLASDRTLGYITSYLVRRTLLVPPMLDSAYIDFFSENVKYYWSFSRFGLGLVSAPYQFAAPNLIGGEVFGSYATSSNTGIIGSGYSNLGIAGVILYSAIFSFLIAYLNAVGKKLGHAFTAAISLPTLVLVLTTTDLTTAVLSHGVLMLLMIVSFLSGKSGNRFEHG